MRPQFLIKKKIEVGQIWEIKFSTIAPPIDICKIRVVGNKSGYDKDVFVGRVLESKFRPHRVGLDFPWHIDDFAESEKRIK